MKENQQLAGNIANSGKDLTPEQEEKVADSLIKVTNTTYQHDLPEFEESLDESINAIRKKNWDIPKEMTMPSFEFLDMSS